MAGTLSYNTQFFFPDVVPAITGSWITAAGVGLVDSSAGPVGVEPVVIAQLTFASGEAFLFRLGAWWSGKETGVHEVPVFMNYFCGDAPTVATFSTCPDADLDGDGSVGMHDLLHVLSAWGSGPSALRFGEPAREWAFQVSGCDGSCSDRPGGRLTGSGVADSNAAFEDARGRVGMSRLGGLKVRAGGVRLDVLATAEAEASPACERPEFPMLLDVRNTGRWPLTVDAPVAFEWVATGRGRLVREDPPAVIATSAAPVSGTLEPGFYTVEVDANATVTEGIDPEFEGTAVQLNIDAPAARRDVDGSGSVDIGDAVVIMSTWGPCGPGGPG
ncbi:MAG: hypothetical protein AB8G96_02455 [Phycisphaerales bacterium]